MTGISGDAGIGGSDLTTAEMAIIDGGTSATATTLADADRVVVNDAGTMVQVALTDFETYFESVLDTLSNVTTVGALNAGSITSGFGTIDTGVSNITTGGIVVLDVDGSGKNAAGSLTLGAGNDAGMYFDGTDTIIDPGGALNLADATIKRGNLLDYGEVTNAIGGTGGGTQDINLTLGNSVTATVDTSANTFTFSNPTASDELCSFTLGLTNGGSQTVNWPGTVDWAGGTAPTLTASGVDWLEFWSVDGGTIWNGALVGAAFA